MSLVTSTLTEIMSRAGIEPLSFTTEDMITTFNHSIEEAEETLLNMIKLTKYIDDEKNSSVAYEKINKAIAELFEIKEKINALKTLYDEKIPF